MADAARRNGKAKDGRRKRRVRRGAAVGAASVRTGAALPEGTRPDSGPAPVAAGTGTATADPTPVDEKRDAGVARAGAQLKRARRRAEVLARQRPGAHGSPAFPRYQRREAARRDLMRRRIRWTLRQATKETRERGDLGMATAEYAVALLAAVGIATVLYKVVTSGAVHSALQAAVMKAFHA
ncbi:DUF4244 domain-containing protein [Streptomyces sp. P6-2-1]|uniref:DUF4244 domain-containing protein n=1 Tax=Streptomyces sp. P6-2-1 TaxID=3422591 RepID=UPI003D36616D